MNALILIATLALSDNTQPPAYVVRHCDLITQVTTIWSLHTVYWDTLCDEELHVRHDEWDKDVEVYSNGIYFYAVRFTGPTLMEVRTPWFLRGPERPNDPCGNDWYRLWKQGIDPESIRRDIWKP